MSNNETFNMYFGIIEDTRCQVDVTYPLISILKLTMLAVLSGIDELDKIVDYGKNKKEFLAKEFEIREIPSKSTLTRVSVKTLTVRTDLKKGRLPPWG